MIVDQDIRRKWAGWDDEMREMYKYFLDLAKPYESKPMWAARTAVTLVERNIAIRKRKGSHTGFAMRGVQADRDA